MVRATLHYGRHHGNVADLWRPDDDARAPVAVLLHGGFWRGRYTKVLMNGLAGSLVERGWATWNVEYRRVGALGGDGGWPATFEDVANAVDFLDGVVGIDSDRVVTIGHSAGGTLALWAACRDRLKDAAPGGPQRVQVRAAVSLAGVLDLDAADALGLGRDAVAKLLGGHVEQRQGQYREASPRALVPLGVPQIVVHGEEDGTIPLSMSEAYAHAARAAGDPVTYLALPGVGHRELIDPGGAAWAAVLDAIESERARW